ncbi:hypothetical protein FRC00_008520 [Tulasnella sp. 408]|nr:hypothetical protein FRC00_008520 [Tulasnella sp. 408]
MPLYRYIYITDQIVIARQVVDFCVKVGLLPKGNEEQVSFAYALYKDKSNDGVKKAYGFKKAFSRYVLIEFMGVWYVRDPINKHTPKNQKVDSLGYRDSVTSVGLNGRSLPYTSHNDIVKTFRQAFSLDERRSKFRHNPWARAARPDSGPTTRLSPLYWLNPLRQNSTGSGPNQPQRNQEQRTVRERAKRASIAVRHTVRLRRETDPRHYRADFDSKDKEGRKSVNYSPSWAITDCKEVWFAGSHSDVGGGEVNTSEDGHKNNLANPSLLWMVQQIDALEAGICWALDAFDDVPTLKAYFSHKQTSNNDPEAKLSQTVIEELQKDVSGKVHDSLGRVTPWWFLEFVPVWKHFLDDNKVQWKEL